MAAVKLLPLLTRKAWYNIDEVPNIPLNMRFFLETREIITQEFLLRVVRASFCF